MELTDSELVDRAVRNDDRDAFGTLVRRHQSAVRGFLRHLAGDPSLADDLAQETFLTAYRTLRRFQLEGRFATWLLGIARNHFLNASRKRARWQALTVPEAAAAGSVPDEPASAGPAAIAGRMDLESALKVLSPDERLALHLAYTQGLSQAEVATAAGWPLGTVKTHIARAKERLRPLLA